MKFMGERRNRSSAMVIVVVVAMVASFILWSIWFPLDQTSRASGQVIPVGKVQIIQSLDGGEITQILVHEGDTVKRGQLLVVLDKVKLAAAVEEARARNAALKAGMARVNAELLNKALVFPADVLAYPEFVNNERVLYNERRAALNAELSGIASQKKLLEDEIELNRPLVPKGDVAQTDMIRMQRQSAELGTQADVRRGRYIQDLQAEFTKTQEDLVTAEQILTQRVDALKNAEFRAPTDGIIKNITRNTIGGVFRPGDEVMEIVPTGEKLIVEAKVSPTDIASLKVGQLANVKFAAYDSSIYGSGTGKITYIAPDTTAQQQQTADGKQEPPSYKIRFSVDTSTMHPRLPGEKIALQPGMTATMEITTGKSTVFRYLTKPIIKTMGESMGER